MEIRLPVFVYGTLRPGEKNYSSYLGGKTIREVSATAEGILHFVKSDGGYPYVVSGAGVVHGELIEINPPFYAETLRSLDKLEEYDPADEGKSLYLRRRTTVHLYDGGTADAWIYYWNRPEAGERIEGGDYRKRRS